MAIAFRSVGARLKADISVAGTPQSVALPPGHTAGDLLFLFVLTDGNSNTLYPSPAGWSVMSYVLNGTSTSSPYTPYMQVKILYRIDNGSLGSTVSLPFSTDAWPAGNPYVLAFTAAYSGCDQSNPIEQYKVIAGAPGGISLGHTVVTTTNANDWVLTYRTVSSDAPAATFTCSVGTDAERVDDSDGFDELACALYDSNTALAAGLQTQRITTASRAATYGSIGYTIAIKAAPPVPPAVAVPPEASVTATAFQPAVQTQDGPWALCDGDLPVYSVTVDWDGQPGGTGEDVTADLVSGISMAYGRDQERQLAPASVGTAAFTLNNVSRRYSPENAASALHGNLDPARVMRAQVVWDGQTYALFTGRVDDYTVKADFADRTTDLSFLDGLNDLSGNTLSTGLYASLRTGDLMHKILDEAGWTGGRDIDPGATVVRWWWLDGTDALTAVNDLVKSEGPPSVAYAAPDGTFVFRDRHHRLLRQSSRTAQAFFHAGTLGDCTSEGVPQGALSLARPFTYAHGWKDIVNSVSFDVPVRVPSADLVQVWSDESTRTLALGESVDLTVSGSDPFTEAVTPVPGTDITYTGPGVLGVLLSRDAGLSARLTLQAIGGPVTVTFVQVRARPLTVQQTVRVSMTDPGSVTRHGERTYPNEAPWAGPEDARAIANAVLLHYAERRPTVQIRIVSSDPAHFVQVLRRTVSDRVRIVNDELGLDSDFFVERVAHVVQRTGTTGRPPVHSVVLGCEKNLDTVANPFRFDVRGAGFDQGVFDPLQADDVASVFVFDDPVQGRFNTGEFGT